MINNAAQPKIPHAVVADITKTDDPFAQKDEIVRGMRFAVHDWLYDDAGVSQRQLDVSDPLPSRWL